MSDERIAELSAQIAAANEPKPAPEPDADAKQPEADPESEQGEGEEREEAAASENVERKPGKKPGVHQRIDELTREKYEARREADELRKRLEALEQGKKPAPEQPAAPQPDAEPTLEQFDFDVAKFTQARDKWVRENAVKEVETKRQQEARESERKAHKEAFDKRLSAFEKDNPGAWDAAVKAPMTLTPPMLEVIATSEHGPHLGVYLSQNLEEADRISKLSPVAAAAALGRIEASLATPRQPERKPSGAPRPPSTLGSPGPAKKDWHQMTTEEHIAAVKARQANHR